LARVSAETADDAAGHGRLAQFLAGLDPGGKDDWVRSALDEPSSATR
jgi:hypothetical protein